MADKIVTLRSQYPIFTYERFTIDYGKDFLKLRFFYTVSDISFTSEVQLPVPTNGVSISDIEPFVFNLGLVEMLSYWKATCSPQIMIKAGFLSKDQKKWWHNLLINGLGEFFFTNKIDFTVPEFVTIDSITGAPYALYTKKHAKTTLIPIGGGKDSIVTLEHYKKNNIAHRCFLLNPNPSAQTVVTTAKEVDPIIITRWLDSHLFELNKQGYLNGHTPFSAYLAFLSILCCVLFDSSLVAVSNEKSSNEGNVQYKGFEINHQYSKSFDFERNFNTYLQQYLCTAISYFSFMRPLGEIQIARLFAQYKNYFGAFKSCNVSKDLRWCGTCPKCASVYALLYPFIERQDMMTIFSNDLFENKNLIGLFEQLLGTVGNKPFECVGTYEETKAALFLAWRSLKQTKGTVPVVLQHFDLMLTQQEKELTVTADRLLHAWNGEHLVPKEIATTLRQELQKI